jgi:ectoine hydroxylase-related dioxygenase (phytanoyl-CoA dioxygenase family)
MNLTAADKRQLDEDGYIVLEDFMSAGLRDGLRREVDRLFLAEGDNAGAEFKQEPGCGRLANLVDKGEIFRSLIVMPELLEYIRHVLGPEIKLSSLNARRVPPQGAGAQPLHVDMSALPDERGYWVCNSVWMLDDFTAENGSLRVIPGSHHWRQMPQQVLSDPKAPHPQQVPVTGRAGTVVVMNAHLWHGGTANHTAASRTAVHAFFCRRDKPQQQYQKKLLRSEVQQTLSKELRYILALDDAANDRLSADVTVRSGFLK